MTKFLHDLIVYPFFFFTRSDTKQRTCSMCALFGGFIVFCIVLSNDIQGLVLTSLAY